MLAGKACSWRRAFFYREQGSAAVTVEHIHDTVLGGLHEDVHHLPVMLNGGEVGRTGNIAIPEIMVNGLEIPFHFPRRCIEGQDAVGEEVHACPVAAIEIRGRRAGAEVDHAPFLIYGEAAPAIGGAEFFIGIFWPGVISEFSRLGYRVEDPFQFARDYIEGAYMSRGCVPRFGHARSDHQRVLIDDARSGSRHGEIAHVVILAFREPFMEVHFSVRAESLDWPAGIDVKGIEAGARGVEDASVISVLPVDQAAAGIEFLRLFYRREFP